MDSKLHTENSTGSGATNAQSDPDGDLIENIILGGRVYWITENVVKSGVLDDLENEATPISVSSFCDKYAYNDDVTGRLFNLLVAIRLVVKTNINGMSKYANSQSTSKYLTRASPKDRTCAILGEKIYVETMLSKLPMVVRNGPPKEVTEIFKEPKTTRDTKIIHNDNGNVQNSNVLDKMNINEMNKLDTKWMSKTTGDEVSEKSPSNFLKIMDSMFFHTQHILPCLFDLSVHRNAVDLGGGSGFVANLFTDHYPQLSVQVFELPHMADIARCQYETHANRSNRLEFVGGDFFKDELPPADLYILSHVLHSWSESKIDILLEKIYKALTPGGELLILEKFLNEDKDGPVIGMSLDITMAIICQGRERTMSEYRHLVAQHGFHKTRVRVVQGNNVFDAMMTAKPT